MSNTAPPGFASSKKPTISPALSSLSSGRSNGGSSVWYNLPKPDRPGEEVETRIRLLPSWTKNADDPYWYEAVEHFGVLGLSDGSRKMRSWVCRETVGDKCPAIEQRLAHFRASKEAGEARSDGPESPHRKKGMALMPRRRYLVQGLLLDDLDRNRQPDGSLQPVVVRLNRSVWKAIEDLERHKGSIADWQWGMPLSIIVRKTGMKRWNIEYKVFDGDRAPLDESLWPALDNLVDLSALLTTATVGEEDDLLSEFFPDAYVPTMPAQPTSTSGDAPSGFARRPDESAAERHDDIPF